MNRVQSYVFWSTAQARQLVRSVLLKEPQIGMHHQQLFNEIVKQFPDEKLPTHLVPAALPTPPERGGAYSKPAPLLVEHPVRSMRYLKKVILEDMLRLKEVERVIVSQHREEKRTKTNALVVKHAEPVDSAETYRWRIVPGSAPTVDVLDPDPSAMFEAKRVEAWRKNVREKNKLLPPEKRMSTAHPPPRKRLMWLREREWKDDGLVDDPFALLKQGRYLTGYDRSSAPRQPFSDLSPRLPEDTYKVQHRKSEPQHSAPEHRQQEYAGFTPYTRSPILPGEDPDTFFTSDDTYEVDSEFSELEPNVPEHGEQEILDALFPEEDDEFTTYFRDRQRKDGSLTHRRQFSLAAGQDSRETKPATGNLSIPPFPRFTEPGISEKERQRLESWQDSRVEVNPQEEKRQEIKTEPASDDVPQINFLDRGLHSSVYVRPSKPRAPRKKPEPEPDDIQPSRIEELGDDSSYPSNIDRVHEEPILGSEITFPQSEAYERSQRPQRLHREPEPERWERDLPEDILPPRIDTRTDHYPHIADHKMPTSATVGIRHSRATVLYETLVRKSLSGPYAVPRLFNVPASRPAYLRSPARREPTESGEDDVDD